MMKPCHMRYTSKPSKIKKLLENTGDDIYMSHNVPRIRFNGFTDDWEQRKLGDISEKVTRKNQNIVCDEVLTNSAEYGIISQRDFFDKDIANSENIDGYYIVEPNDFVYNPRISNLAPFGPIRRNKLEKSGAMSPLYYVFRTHGVDYGFLEYYFKTNGWHSFMHLNGNSGARSDRFAIRDDIFKEMPITMPQNVVEQQAIGKYFTNLDSLITLHQRKLETLKKLKKSMLQKMFPKNGSLYPEIRFSGFTDAWEQRKLGELADIIGGGTPSTSISEYWDGDIDWYAPAEISDKIYVDSSERKITKAGYENSSAKMLPVGTVLFTSRAGIGKTTILRKEACTNQGFQSIVPHKNMLDSYFIFSRTDELKRYGETMGAGSTFVEVSGKQMASMKLMIPKTIEEQQAIGQYFTNLDNLITLHQRKCETLKKLKKSMLQKMFV